jgi:vitamin B12 transporter
MRLRLACWVLAVALIAMPAWAVEKTAPTTQIAASDVSKIEKSTVTAGRIKQQILDVTVPVDIIDSTDIEASGVDDLGDVLGKFMTGHLHKYSGVLTPIGIRGFRTESHGDDLKGHVLILVDGHRTGTGNASKLDMDRVERIEILKGPYSALYGSAAMGGVVNIITKKGSGPLGAKLRAEYGSFGYHKLGVAGGGEVDLDGEDGDKKFKFFINTSYRHTDSYDTPDYGEVYNTANQHQNFGWNTTYEFNKKHSLRWGGNYADIKGGYPSWGAGTNSYYIPHTQNFDKSHGYTDLEYNGEFMDGFLSWRSMFYHLWDRNHWKYGTAHTDDTGVKYTDKTYGTDQQFTFDFGPMSTLVAGFTLETLEKESEGITNGEPSAPYTPAMEYNTMAFFAQDHISLLDGKLNFVASLRYDYFDLETKKPSTGEYEEFNAKSESFDHISPKAGVSYNFMDRMLRARANVGSGFKTPSADQLSAEYRDSNDIGYLGNPDLDPETSFTWDVGMDLFHSIIDVGFTYWHSDYQDKIVTASEQVLHNGEYWTTYENLGDAEISGVDISIDLRLHKLIAMPAKLSLHNRTTFNLSYEDKETGDDLNYVSEFETKTWVTVGYQGFSASLFYVVVGPQMTENWDTWPTSVEEKETFSFWDFNASYAFLEQWKVTFNIYNLFNDGYEWVYGYQQPERNYRLAVTYQF